MCRIIKVGVGGFSHLAFKKITVVLNSLKKTSCSDRLIFLLPLTSVLENKKTLGTRLGGFHLPNCFTHGKWQKGQQMQVSGAL